MTGMTVNRMVQSAFAVGVTLALLGVGAAGEAQTREGSWEFSVGAVYQLGNDLSFEGGSSITTDDDFGLTLGFGYHFSDRLQASFGFLWSDVSYDAEVVSDDGGRTGISGSYEAWGTSANLVLNLMDGPVTPYLGAGIGWTWIDTNVPNGLPATGCWWDPWYGYVCFTTYPTKTTDALSYQATAGVRYEFNSSTFMRLGYTSQWIDLDKADGSPRFDVVAVEVGWLF